MATVTPRASILVADGDADTRMLYRALLADLAASIIEAKDGTEALEKALREHPDVIVTESRLDGIDGYALCARLRQEPATKSATIVFVTGSAYPTELARAASAGADQVLVKPCEPEALIAACRAARS